MEIVFFSFQFQFPFINISKSRYICDYDITQFMSKAISQPHFYRNWFENTLVNTAILSLVINQYSIYMAKSHICDSFESILCTLIIMLISKSNIINLCVSISVLIQSLVYLILLYLFPKIQWWKRKITHRLIMFDLLMSIIIKVHKIDSKLSQMWLLAM